MATETMNVCIKTVSDIEMLRSIESQWDSLVRETSENPFLLTSLVRPLILLKGTSGWSPMIITISHNEKLMGIIPLVTRRAFGLRSAEFFMRPAYSPDFIFCNENRNDFAPLAIDCLFNRLGCHLLSLDFRTNSQYLRMLTRECKRSGIYCSEVPKMGHRVLSVRSTWQDFEKSKGGNFRRKFRKIERNLDRIGVWKITCAGRNQRTEEVLSKILEVEKESWKETSRAKKGAKVDDVLLAILEGLSRAAQVQPDLDWAVWFLEADGHPVAYTLVILYAGVAYVTKTSYNAQYRRLYPGIYVNHVAIHQLWDTGKVKLIDFLTDLPFMETWTDDVEGCTRVVISKNPILPLLLGPFQSNEYVKKTFGPAVIGALGKIPGLGRALEGI